MTSVALCPFAVDGSAATASPQPSAVAGRVAVRLRRHIFSAVRPAVRTSFQSAMAVADLKPKTALGILDASFGLVRAHAAVMLTIWLLVLTPAAIVGIF